MFYPHNKNGRLQEELFRNPPQEYRGAPFWAWNCKLDKDFLRSQVHQFKEMGMGGFHVHCRTGLGTTYLSPAFFDCIDGVKREAEKENLRLYLYDEDRWPSGFAGGYVTKDKRYRKRYIIFSPVDEDQKMFSVPDTENKSDQCEYHKELARYSIVLDSDGYLIQYNRINDHIRDSNIWIAKLEIAENSPWYNNQAYVNTLDPGAIRCFINETHEKYYQHYCKDFGGLIPSIFSDEPQTMQMGVLSNPFAREPVIIPYTDDFSDTFQAVYGYSLLDRLPELVWEYRNQVSPVRFQFHEHLVVRFSEAFGDQIGTWCSDHGIALTGHMLNECTLSEQTEAAGDVMRPMMYFEIPGIDMLCDARELSTAKQAASVARQMGREGVMSEEYGVNGWDYDFRSHLLEGNWQAALGVTFRVLHLTWLSMEGEAKRDYPASIGYQVPWYKEYKKIEDHFARINTALTRGKAEVKIGVIHPVESFWLVWGNDKQTGLIRKTKERQFKQIIDWLLFNFLDFDFISEAMLATDELEEKENKPDMFTVGQMNYQVIIVPACMTLRKTTFDRLKKFKDAGGKVIIMGNIPDRIDAVPNPEIQSFANKCMVIDFDETALMRELEEFRTVDVYSSVMNDIDSTGVPVSKRVSRTNNMVYQLRRDGAAKWLFLSHVYNPQNRDIVQIEKYEIHIKGNFQPVWYDTMTGEITSLAADFENGWTKVVFYGAVDSSLLLRLDPGHEKRYDGYTFSCSFGRNKKCLPEPIDYHLEEPNVLLLDMASYSFDMEPWHDEEEILRIDNSFRRKLGYPLRMDAVAQPWVVKEDEIFEHTLHLKFRVSAMHDFNNLLLGLENLERTKIKWNHRDIPSIPIGWYTDKHIQTTALGAAVMGENVLELTIPFSQKSNIEACYLLGKFGVDVRGTEKKLIDLPSRIYYGDLTRQNFPFYGGSLLYKAEVETLEGELWLEISAYRGALMHIWVDERDCGAMFAAPYRLDCGKVSEGIHTIRCMLYGTRENTFGALHNFDRTEKWYGPNIWRTTGNKWSYEYQFAEFGILKAPLVWIESQS